MAMSSADLETCIKFLVERLPDADKADLQAILGGQIESVAQDVVSGRVRIAADAMPDRLRRQIRSLTASDRSTDVADFHKRFPNAARLG